MKTKKMVIVLLIALTMLSSISLISAAGEDGLITKQSNKKFWFIFTNGESVNDVDSVDTMTYAFYLNEIETTGSVSIKGWYVKGDRIYVLVDTTTKPHLPKGATDSTVVIEGKYTNTLPWSVTGAGFRWTRAR